MNDSDSYEYDSDAVADAVGSAKKKKTAAEGPFLSAKDDIKKLIMSDRAKLFKCLDKLKEYSYICGSLFSKTVCVSEVEAASYYEIFKGADEKQKKDGKKDIPINDEKLEAKKKPVQLLARRFREGFPAIRHLFATVVLHIGAIFMSPSIDELICRLLCK